jgi:hypothetical protein
VNVPSLDAPRHVTIGSIVICCHEFDRMLAFWKAALFYIVGHVDPNGGFVILRDPRGMGPNVSLDQSPTKRTGRRSGCTWIYIRGSSTTRWSGSFGLVRDGNDGGTNRMQILSYWRIRIGIYFVLSRYRLRTRKNEEGPNVQ